MSSDREHREHGFKVAAQEYLTVCRESGKSPNLPELIFVAFLGSIAATVPDVIDDPEAGPGHRGVGHSIEAYRFLRKLHMEAKQNGRAGEAALIRAGLTHFEDDAKTPAGLPSVTIAILRRILGR